MVVCYTNKSSQTYSNWISLVFPTFFLQWDRVCGGLEGGGMGGISHPFFTRGWVGDYRVASLKVFIHVKYKSDQKIL